MPKRLTLSEIITKLMMHVDKDSSPKGCWLWTGDIGSRGYGGMNVTMPDGYYAAQAHRVSYICFHGPIPKGLHVLHKCHIKPCVNPDHIYAGTHWQNMNDKVAAGTTNRGRKIHKLGRQGSRNPNSKLTELRVRVIRALYRRGWHPSNIAKAVDTRSNVWDIVHKKVWKHVP